MTDKTVIPLSWDAVHRDLEVLAKRLAKHGTWRGIVAVTRGGLVPAAIIARALDIRLIDTVCITSYQDKTPGLVDILKPPEAALKDKGADWLVIDDIVDTGATISAIRELLPNAIFAALYAKANTKQLVDAYLHEAGDDIWIDFPWET